MRGAKKGKNKEREEQKTGKSNPNKMWVPCADFFSANLTNPVVGRLRC
jgi:hypothetical protein